MLLDGGLTKAHTEFSIVAAINAVEGREDDLKACLD